MPKDFSLLITPIILEVVFSISLALTWYENWSKQGKVDALTPPHYYLGTSNSKEKAAVVLKPEG